MQGVARQVIEGMLEAADEDVATAIAQLDAGYTLDGALRLSAAYSRVSTVLDVLGVLSPVAALV